jgi:hypothetical protein
MNKKYNGIIEFELSQMLNNYKIFNNNLNAGTKVEFTVYNTDQDFKDHTNLPGYTITSANTILRKYLKYKNKVSKLYNEVDNEINKIDYKNKMNELFYEVNNELNKLENVNNINNLSKLMK